MDVVIYLSPVNVKCQEVYDVTLMSIKKNKLCSLLPAEIPAVAIIEEHSVQPEQLPGQNWLPW